MRSTHRYLSHSFTVSQLRFLNESLSIFRLTIIPIHHYITFISDLHSEQTHSVHIYNLTKQTKQTNEGATKLNSASSVNTNNAVPVHSDTLSTLKAKTCHRKCRKTPFCLNCHSMTT